MTSVLDRRRASIGGELGDVAEVRHAITGWMREWGLTNLVDDVELVASELLTNAILHAGGDVDVLIQRRHQGVRIVVGDGRPDLVPAPQEVPIDRLGDDELDMLAWSVFEGTTTGRGLLLVDAFADAWGVTVSGASKEVWAEIGTGRRMDAPKPPEPPPPAVPGVAVSLRDVPVRLVLLSAANMDDLVRELQTTSFAVEGATELAALGEQLVHDTVAQREPLRVAARSALRKRVRRLDVELEVPPAQVDVLRRFVDLTGQVEVLCHDGVLLSEPPSPELTAFRRWYVDELDRQVGGQAPGPCPFPE
jgi:anti-sigma regulatory factor (Ser/Thr protein kinase)